MQIFNWAKQFVTPSQVHTTLSAAGIAIPNVLGLVVKTGAQFKDNLAHFGVDGQLHPNIVVIESFTTDVDLTAFHADLYVFAVQPADETRKLKSFVGASSRQIVDRKVGGLPGSIQIAADATILSTTTA